MLVDPSIIVDGTEERENKNNAKRIRIHEISNENPAFQCTLPSATSMKIYIIVEILFMWTGIVFVFVPGLVFFAHCC